MITIPIGHFLPSTLKQSGWKVYMLNLYTWITWKCIHLLTIIIMSRVIQPPCCCSIMYTQTFVPLVASIHVCIDSCIWSLIFMSVLFIDALYYKTSLFPFWQKGLALPPLHDSISIADCYLPNLFWIYLYFLAYIYIHIYDIYIFYTSSFVGVWSYGCTAPRKWWSSLLPW